MGETTKISWADATFNPWIGCTKVSRGCDLCYAEELMDHRYGKVEWGPNGARVRTSERNWNTMRKLQRQAEADGTRPRVFCASLADVFDAQAPLGALGDLWGLIFDTPCLDYLLLTKRPQRIQGCLPATWDEFDSQHCWLGVSTEDQETFDLRWPVLSRFQESPVLFLSVEPMLGPIQLPDAPALLPDWVIIGGESGRGARRMEPEWVEDLIGQCRRRRIAVWFKQWGTDHTYYRDPEKGGELIGGQPLQEVPTPRYGRYLTVTGAAGYHESPAAG